MLIITLNVNKLNASTKTQRLAYWIQKQVLYIHYLQEIHFRCRDTYKMTVKRWIKILHVKRNQKKAGVVILISEKNRF